MSLNPEASLLLSHSVGFRSPRANVKASEEISIESWLRLSDVSFWLVDRVRGQVCIVSLALSRQLSSMSSLNCLRRDVSVGKTRNASAALCPSLKYEACVQHLGRPCGVSVWLSVRVVSQKNGWMGSVKWSSNEGHPASFFSEWWLLSFPWCPVGGCSAWCHRLHSHWGRWRCRAWRAGGAPARTRGWAWTGTCSRSRARCRWITTPTRSAARRCEWGPRGTRCSPRADSHWSRRY